MDFSFWMLKIARPTVRLSILLLALLVCVSCGDVFRPIAIPIIPTPPNPAGFHTVFVLSNNGSSDPGSSFAINVSGDTDTGVAKTGIAPVHAAILPNLSRIYIANSGEDTLSTYAPSSFTNVTTISLPAGSKPSFVGTAQNDVIYVADTGLNTVSLVSTSSNIVTKTLAVGANPVALAETPDSKQVFVVNQGDNTVSLISTTDNTVVRAIPVGVAPVAAVARFDSQRAYVLNRDSGTVSVIDTTLATDVSQNPVISSATVGVGANFMFYDQHLSRLYVVNPTTRQVPVLDISKDPPIALPTIDLGAGPSPPCPAGCVVSAVTALVDGTRAYVVSYQQSATCAVTTDTPPCISTNVTVVSTTGNSIIKTINVDPGGTGEVTAVPACDPARFRRFIVASGDTSRVYVSNCDAGNAAIIRTSDDTYVLNLTAPNGILSPTAPPGAQPPPQNPVFILVGN